jgi:hypothetical protein
MHELTSVENVPMALEQLRENFRTLMEEGRLELPLLPGIAAQVMQASSDQDCDTKRLSDIIHRDQAMASHVLRLANSPLYMSRMQIVSLQQAVSRLGMKKIREMALIISCESRVFQVKGFETEVRALFRHSLAAGAFAQEIARMRRWNVKRLFSAGFCMMWVSQLFCRRLLTSLRLLRSGPAGPNCLPWLTSSTRWQVAVSSRTGSFPPV